jgi:hypothetical protein
MMNASPQQPSERIWKLIEAEKGRDRMLRRVSTGAWILTFVALLFAAVIVGINVWWAARLFIQGSAHLVVVFREAMPLVWIVGGVSLLVAVLTTAALLLRFRAASLDEIRLRLAAVEQMLTDKSQSGENGLA